MLWFEAFPTRRCQEQWADIMGHVKSHGPICWSRWANRSVRILYRHSATVRAGDYFGAFVEGNGVAEFPLRLKGPRKWSLFPD